MSAYARRRQWVLAGVHLHAAAVAVFVLIVHLLAAHNHADNARRW